MPMDQTAVTGVTDTGTAQSQPEPIPYIHPQNEVDTLYRLGGTRPGTIKAGDVKISNIYDVSPWALTLSTSTTDLALS